MAEPESAISVIRDLEPESPSNERQVQLLSDAPNKLLTSQVSLVDSESPSASKEISEVPSAPPNDGMLPLTRPAPSNLVLEDVNLREASASATEELYGSEINTQPATEELYGSEMNTQPAPLSRIDAEGTETSPPIPSVAPRARSSTLTSLGRSSDGRPRLLAGVLIVQSLETILKDAKKNVSLRDATRLALDALKGAPGAASAEPRLIFEPLRLACESQNYPMVIVALDCIGKLVTQVGHEASYQTSPNLHVAEDLTPETISRRTSVEAGTANFAAAAGSDTRLADDIVNAVCGCFVETANSTALGTTAGASAVSVSPSNGPEAVNLHILSVLISLILASNMPVHQTALLTAVRTVYNIFLLSRGHQTQMVAQGALGQIVGAVFGRVTTSNANGTMDLESPKIDPADMSRERQASGLSDEFIETVRSPAPHLNGSHHLSKEVHADHAGTHARSSTDTVRSGMMRAGSGSTSAEAKGAKGSSDAKQPNDVDSGNEEPNELLRQTKRRSPSPGPSNLSNSNLPRRRSLDGDADHGKAYSTKDLHIKDAFLVFRALCKLSTKPLGSESERDLKSHAMRSKLLSLHLILTILHNHLPLFLDVDVAIVSSSTQDKTPFVHAIRNYLFFAVNRNAVSSIIPVYELSCEIFWRMVSGLRARLKNEIALLMNEIFLPLLEMRQSSAKQKSILLGILSRVCYDPQALVEIYLNYDCDRGSLDNVYERLINVISRIGTTHFTSITPAGPSTAETAASRDTSGGGNLAAMPPVPVPANIPMIDPIMINMPYEARLKRQSLECLVFVLRSLVAWSGKSVILPNPVDSLPMENLRLPVRRSEEATSISLEPPVIGNFTSGTSTPEPPVGQSDDPSRFENAKQRKTTLLEGIKKFNFKPKRGISFLTETGFIATHSPIDVARFLLHADGLNKAAIGEFLGEGDAENIEIMHVFVDMMEFTEMRFVDALRMFLQSFRLPGEAQKIDRFMLKFAERFVAGNPSTFANADTAYVLSYSVIMLNTDLYNPQNKKRMTKVEFIKNNRGINDGQDLPEQLLSDIFDEIATNEIRMKDEIDLAIGLQGSGISGAIAGVGRDSQRAQYVLQSENMATKTEALFRSMLRQQRRTPKGGEVYFSASHFEHVKPMFTVVWMPLLAGLSAPLQDSDDIDMVNFCLDGFKQAVKIVCLFDLELERNAFVTTLAKFTFLNNLGEMKPKNVEAIRALLDIAMVDGNYLKASWRDILACVSQLERFQLIAQGVDLGPATDLVRKPQLAKQISSRSSRISRPPEEVARETASSHITMAAERIFSTSNTLSGTAIVDFVQALSDVSWEEIQTSGLDDQPRTFCLQKLVEISYYNMERIRLEWSNMWAILGEHFNQVCCHSNPKISYFALDSLRQLASRFLEKEELAHFKFQKDFLKPFQHAMVHNNNNDVRDMILQCLRQMIQARVDNLRSGWRTMFGVFSAASKIMTERVVGIAFEMVKELNRVHFSAIVAHGAFADLAVCITDFCKISKYQKISLFAVEMLRSLVQQMLSCPECPLIHPLSTRDGESHFSADDPLKWWFPVLFGFYDVIMNGEDLEVRKRALDYLFETLKEHGTSFPFDLWQHVCKEVLFPIFTILSSQTDVSRLSAHEDMSVWLSTTMIQALRNLVDLFSFYFDVLGRMLDRLLRLLRDCICQENDTLARIGTACLQQLIEKNVKRLSPEHWDRIVSTFITLFKRTTAHQLFDEKMRIPDYQQLPVLDGGSASGEGKSGFVLPLPLSPGLTETAEAKHLGAEPPSPSLQTPMRLDRKQVFRQIIVKCVLQLLLIETAHELLQSAEVYSTIPPTELLRLMTVLDDSYRFAKRFNADKDLRTGLWKVGFMKQLPNLLKQESSSAAVLVSVLLRMYSDHRPDHIAKRSETVDAFVPLGVDVLSGFITLDPDTQGRNVAAWTPVAAEVLQGFAAFADTTVRSACNKFRKGKALLTGEQLASHVLLLFPLCIDLLAREMPVEVRESVRQLLIRIGVVQGLLTSPPDGEAIAEEEEGAGE